MNDSYIRELSSESAALWSFIEIVTLLFGSPMQNVIALDSVMVAQMNVQILMCFCYFAHFLLCMLSPVLVDLTEFMSTN